MTYVDINALEQAGRAAMVWAPEPSATRPHIRLLLAALAAAITILAAAAGVLLFSF